MMSGLFVVPERSERFSRRTFDDGASRSVARAMAGTVPIVFIAIPLHVTMLMRAITAQTMGGAIGAGVGGDVFVWINAA